MIAWICIFFAEGREITINVNAENEGSAIDTAKCFVQELIQTEQIVGDVIFIGIGGGIEMYAIEIDFIVS